MAEIQIPLSGLTTKASKRSNHESSSPSEDYRSDANLKRIGLTTMGCKVNAYESELISEAFKTDQWITVPATDIADLYIINTCTVTQEADKQARREVRKVVRMNPEALVIVTGCYAQMDSQACAEIPGVDLVVGNDRKLDIHGLLPALQKG